MVKGTDWGSVSASIMGDSESVSRDLKPSSVLHRHLHACAHTHTHRYPQI